MSELYKLPAGWEWKKLESISKTTSGGTPKRNVKEYWNGKIGWLKSGELNDSYINKVQEFITDEGVKKSSAKIFPKGSLLMAMYGATVGRLGILNIDTTTNQAVCAILNDKNKFETKYLFYFLKNIRKDMLRDSFGGAQPNLSQTYIKNLNIPLPPLAEQKRIVAKLDSLFEKINKATELHQQNITNAKALMASTLDKTFKKLEGEYSLETVDTICDKITDGTHSTPKYVDNRVYFLSVKDISKGFIYFSNTKFISREEHFILSKRCNVEKGGILYTKVGTTGIAKVVDVDQEFSIFVSIALLKNKKDIVDSYYFEYLLNSPNCYEQAQNRTRGVANRNLVLRDIKEINLPLPPLPIQQQTVEYLDSIATKVEKIKQLNEQKLENLKALKASILDKAFCGEL
ncbi:restriction endonuclease subunit S [Francisella sp. TX07-6608]|uniref:restriction endonuclease subunit S n=1 Tax=Francisella sp. TX07-6608 TaxID=573568 RepID=UPI0008F98EA9|nr:restriction endonuclease subunit S [Francisella sp. TX07-6608]OIN84758.1 type I restriction modification DNA specificity domain protein [Francisella sp. TX07-6608]